MLSLKEASRILNRDVNQDALSFNSLVFPYSKVVLVYNNPEYLSHFQKKDLCYAILHAGFSVASNHGFTRELTKDTDKYGNYSEYSKNISQLIERLRKSNDLSLFYVDESCFSGDDVYSLEFLPSISNLVLVTHDADGLFKKSLKTSENHKVDLYQEKIYPFLKNIGVKEILLAGEWVWQSGNGCLGVVAEELQKNGFEVKGVKGCLYPSVPKLDSELLKKLYQDQVAPF